MIVAGEARIDESMITGESKPVSKTAGDPVTGATVLLKGDCVMRATQVGADTVLSQIAAMVARAQATKAPVQQLADKIARYFVPAVMIIAIWTFAIWVSLGPAPQLAHALVTAVSVLIIACPCALGLATPLSVTVSLGLGATNGVLVTSAKALEQARRIGTVVFDKTGTITRGVVDAAADWDKPSYEQDTVKEGSREAVAALRARGIRTVMLSGDKAEVAGRIAREVGIDTVICEVKPDGKAYWIAKLQRERDEATAKSAYGTSRTAAQSRTLIAMVGDGINDAPALAQADLGIAIGTGTDVAMQSADVTLMSGDLRGVIKTINLSNATMRNIRENLGWAFGYNVIGIPLDATKSEIAKTFSDTGFSRLPVYDDDIDHIVGIVYQKDFHNHIYHTNKPLSSIIRPALFVTENTKVGPLLKKMQAKKSHIAIIIDEFGGTDGIITMEDILEELVGEIWDEHDAVVQEIQKVSENEYLVTGTASIDKVYEELDIDKEFDVFTVSGWIMGILERVPKEGDHFVSDGLDVTVLKMADRRVDKVRIVRLPKDENEQ